ncbi:MAG: diadenylate cyclase CdaA [Clostridia bacterium]|nr:diadenylate cyclase CdaA [Clostridia bacterium]
MSTLYDFLYSVWNRFFSAVLSMRILDGIDILIIAFLIYKVIEFLLQTRAGQLVKGLFVLLAAYTLAILFKLTMLRWLLAIVVDSALVVLVVIFQPELRRLLERIGRTNLARGQMMDEETEKISNCIDNVGKAAGMMQEQKIGALIVFERTTQLGEIIHTGTVIDAEASVAMINNIFFPKSPLHDGALIVREGRLYAAGCILPLTQSQNVPPDLGTRHRAAIGMSENSDAIVLVVSEETGVISIINNGEITRNYNAASASAELRRNLIDSELERRDNVLFSSLKRIFSFGKNNPAEEEEKHEK